MLLQRQDQLEHGVFHAAHDEQDDAACLIGMRGRKDAFLDPLAHDGGEPGRPALGHDPVQLLAHDRVVIGKPDAHHVEDQRLLRAACLIQDGEKLPQFRCRGKSRILDKGSKRLVQIVLAALDQGLEEIGLRVEVVVERPFGDRERIKDVLDAHLLVALGEDELLRSRQDGVAPGQVFLGINGTGHRGS